MKQGKTPILKKDSKKLHQKCLGKKKTPPQRLSRNSNKTAKFEENSDIYGQTEEKDYSDSDDENGEEEKEEESPPRDRGLRRSSRRSSEKQSSKNALQKRNRSKFNIQKGRSKRQEDTYDSYDDSEEDQDSQNSDSFQQNNLKKKKRLLDSQQESSSNQIN